MDRVELFFMIELSKSEKFAIVKKIAEEKKCVIVSFANILYEIRRNNYTDRSKNEKAFSIFHQRIRDCLQSGKNVIADAPNITMRERRSLFASVKTIPCYKIAYIIPERIEQCIQKEYSIPQYVLQNQMAKFQIPFKEEGFDEIVIHKFKDDCTDDTFVQKCYARMQEFDQKNPHHNMNLGDHCKFVRDKFKAIEEYADTEYIFAATLHDIGKLFTQSFDEQGIAHYYNHENVGCYYLLSNAKNFKDYTDEEFLNILFLVNFHMLPATWNNCKASAKWRKRFGEYKYRMLLVFNECDKTRQ